MVPVMSLVVPILVSAVIVFVASSIIHMMLPYHQADFGKLSKEDEVMEALRRFSIEPGDYVVPCAGSPAGMKKPEFLDKMNKGPVAFMTVLRPGSPAMGTSLVLWFLFSVLVSTSAGYIAGRALAAGDSYLEMFRFVGAAAFMGYSYALLQNSIWYSRNWRMTTVTMFDGLVYALLTAGTFGWLWPR